MIGFDFAYYTPSTVNEAVDLYHVLTRENQDVMYYGGGTEFISRARMEEIKADAVIDIKGIPECQKFVREEWTITIGSAVTLTAITDSDLFPLLSNVSREIATRTERNKITIGGNLSSNLVYREAILPFLIADSDVLIAGKQGIRRTSIRKMQLQKGEFIIQLITDREMTEHPYSNVRKTKSSKVNYPVLSLASIHTGESIGFAFSGVCAYPFCTSEMDQILNDTSLSISGRAEEAIEHLPSPVLNDMQASSGYRIFLLKQALSNMIEEVS